MSKLCTKCNTQTLSSPTGIGVMTCITCRHHSFRVPELMPFNVAYPATKAWIESDDLNQFLRSYVYLQFLIESKKLGHNPFIYPGDKDDLVDQTDFPETLLLIMNAYDKYKDKTI